MDEELRGLLVGRIQDVCNERAKQGSFAINEAAKQVIDELRAEDNPLSSQTITSSRVTETPCMFATPQFRYRDSSKFGFFEPSVPRLRRALCSLCKVMFRAATCESAI
jgi:hypothetical protein